MMGVFVLRAWEREENDGLFLVQHPIHAIDNINFIGPTLDSYYSKVVSQQINLDVSYQ